MQVGEIMARAVETVGPDDTVEAAAARMAERDVGALPVVEDGRLVGMVTDRDVVIRVMAVGHHPRTTRLREFMSMKVETCRPEEPLAAAARRMGERRLRRLPVVDGGGRLVGMLALGEVARADGAEAAEALRRISVPGGRHDQVMEAAAPLKPNPRAF